MKTALKLFGWLVLAVVVIVGAAVAWATWQLSKDRPSKPRPQYSNYVMGNGAADGSPTPDASGFVLDSAGRGRILPPLPPEKPMDIHTAANYKRNFALRSCFWPGPRARSGVFSNDGNSFTFENQFPDTGTTYIPTAFKLPEGGEIIIKGQYPHMRHWNFNTYNVEGQPQDALSDVDINPDAGSSNPFRQGVARDVAQRNYTIRIVNGQPPANRPANTLYTKGAAGQDAYLWMRNFVPDHSIDYLGAVPLPTVAFKSPDGKVVEGDAACDAVKSDMRGKQLKSSVDPRAWALMTHLPWMDSDNIGAKDAPAVPLQAFFNRKQVVMDLVAPAIAPSNPELLGGWWSNLASRYGYAYLSHNYGSVYVMTARMPKTPRTWNGDTQNAPSDMRYMSICMGGALSSAVTPDCAYDEQILPSVDAQTGRYAVVISRGDERPKNATTECGVTWLDAGNGDGLPSGSSDYMFIINRHTQVDPAFKQSWFAVKQHGGEKEAMGDYLPYVLNLKTQANFESLGCPVDKSKLWAMLPTSQPR